MFDKKEEDSYWVSVSDLMSVLMMVFLFIAIAYMLKTQQEKQRLKEVAVTYNRLQNELYDDLNLEFQDDLSRWDAIIDRSTLSVTFQSPEVLFEPGSAELRIVFKSILGDFFPRYLAILDQEKYRDDIEEIRIEGHTSSEWSKEVSALTAYFYNMELSQNRTRAVLNYVMTLPDVYPNWQWLKRKITANGLSSSKLSYTDNGQEDKELSRRVEFRVRTNAEQRLVKILSSGE